MVIGVDVIDYAVIDVMGVLPYWWDSERRNGA